MSRSRRVWGRGRRCRRRGGVEEDARLLLLFKLNERKSRGKRRHEVGEIVEYNSGYEETTVYRLKGL